MARAAAKRRPPARPDHDRRHKDSGGQRFEDTLFFNRLRKQAKWVFVVLAVVFGGGFVLFGVGSDVAGTGLSDIFSGIRGGGGGSSISKELKKTQENPKDAAAWRALAAAYDTKGDLPNAISAWTTYTELRPKDVDGLTQLATDYQQQLAAQTQEAQLAAYEAQTAQASTFGPPASSPLGRALDDVANPIASSVSEAANVRYNAALQQRQATASQLVDIYQRIAKLQPREPAAQLQLAQAAQDAGDAGTAVAAYKQFVKLAPFDNQVPYAKQQVKALEQQLAGTP